MEDVLCSAFVGSHHFGGLMVSPLGLFPMYTVSVSSAELQEPAPPPDLAVSLCLQLDAHKSGAV